MEENKTDGLTTALKIILIIVLLINFFYASPRIIPTLKSLASDYATSIKYLLGDLLLIIITLACLVAAALLFFNKALGAKIAFLNAILLVIFLVTIQAPWLIYISGTILIILSYVVLKRMDPEFVKGLKGNNSHHHL